LKVLKAIDKDFLSLRDSSIKFNIPDPGIIVKWKKDFATFGLVGLEPKNRGKPKTMNTNKRKKRKSDKPLTREEELLLEIEALQCENELLKKLQALIQAEEKARKRKP
jgi:transposase